MFEGFRLERVEVGPQVCLRVRVGGRGPAVVLLHGHPRTHTTWYRVAPRLAAAGFTVVCPDLRGYGGSTAPPPETDHAQASKRAMAADIVTLMGTLGMPRFAVVGHDRGSYVAFRLAMDHPHLVTSLAVLDSVPIGEALARVDARFAQEWWHWFFFAQPDVPERAILADPDVWYRTGNERRTAMGADNYADFLRAVHDPVVVQAMLEDYRAGLGVDRGHDDADRAAGRRARLPHPGLLVHPRRHGSALRRSPRRLGALGRRPARATDRQRPPRRRGEPRRPRRCAAEPPRATAAAEPLTDRLTMRCRNGGALATTGWATTGG